VECEARNLNQSTLRKYRALRTKLGKFVEGTGIRSLPEFTPDAARAFRGSWTFGPRTTSKELERLRAFFNFCVENGWITKNPAKAIKAPEVKPNPTLPFSAAEVSRIVANTDARSATFFKLLMHSGLRIVDAAMLRPERVNDGKLFLYQQKTGVPVWVPLPPDLLSDLSALTLTGGYYFVVESAFPVSVAEYYRQKLKKAAKAAKVDDAHPHRFRDTFAVNLLQAGVPIEEVSVLLGHTDIKTTQRHYAPWVQSRQDRLQELVSRTWKKPKLVRVK
jgi:integrase/recombinase XerD